MTQREDSPELRDASLWYAAGLRFECTRCGSCCRGAGNVWVSDGEIEALAQRFEMTGEEFRAAFTRAVPRRGVVLRAKRSQDCVFWDPDAGCSVYDDRPRQCRTYPFWSGHVHSAGSWEAERASCPGIGQGALHSAAEIRSTSADDGIPPKRSRLRTGGA